MSSRSRRRRERREKRAVNWKYDVLYGSAVIRPSWACRVRAPTFIERVESAWDRIWNVVRWILIGGD